MNSLLVIDDSKLRKQAFSAAHKLIKQIEKLEHDLAAFHDEDQKLFSHWDRATFQHEREKIAHTQAEFEYLCRFYNWMIALAEMQKISLEKALLMLKREEELYEEGSDEERRKIDFQRTARDQFIRGEARRQADEDAHSAEDASDEWIDEDEYEDEEEEHEFDILQSMSDAELRHHCRSKSGTAGLLARLINYRRGEQDVQLFFRIWNLLSPKLQRYVAAEYEMANENTWNDFLAKLRRHYGLSEDAPPPTTASTTTAADAGESLKQLYHRLVRQLHPDLNDLTPWHGKVWSRVQHAYQKQNHFELQKLAQLVRIRGHKLNELTFSEILDSQNWLKQELASLRREARSYGKSPAWRFSKRKDFKPVIRKIKKTLEKELSYIEGCTRDLRDQLNLREMFARQKEQGSRRRRRPRSTARA